MYYENVGYSCKAMFHSEAQLKIFKSDWQIAVLIANACVTSTKVRDRNNSAVQAEWCVLILLRMLFAVIYPYVMARLKHVGSLSGIERLLAFHILCPM